VQLAFFRDEFLPSAWSRRLKNTDEKFIVEITDPLARKNKQRAKRVQLSKTLACKN